MNKTEIIKVVTERTGLPQKEVSATLDALLNIIQETMTEKREDVGFRGFGSFIVKKRAAKTARNIQKNTTVIIPAHDYPDFKPAREFIERMKAE